MSIHSESDGTVGERRGLLHGVLVTFRRPAELTVTLQRLADQTRRLDTLVVVDNDSFETARDVVAGGTNAAEWLEYRPAGDNLGPAGGLEVGLSRVLTWADDNDWVVFLDDDDPPRTRDMLAELLSFAETMLLKDARTGAVGLVGARFDLRTGLAVRIPDEDLNGPVPVDYIGGGQLPYYRVGVVREVGLPDRRLFFGFDDLEYGLRFRAAGWRFYIDGGLCLRERREKGLVGVKRQPSRSLVASRWQDYYSTRNLLWILRRHGNHATAGRVVGSRVLGKAMYNLPRSPTFAAAHLAMGARAAFDAYTSRMGRTVSPIV